MFSPLTLDMPTADREKVYVMSHPVNAMNIRAQMETYAPGGASGNHQVILSGMRVE